MKNASASAKTDSQSTNGTDANVSLLDRAVNILDAFSEAQPELTLTEIVGKTQLHKATAHRLLASLRKLHLIEKDEGTGKYSLGLRMIAYADIAKGQNSFVARGRATMLELREQTRQTIYLSVRMGDYRYDVEQIQGFTETRLSVSLGEAKLLEIGAAGHVMLAAMSADEFGEYLSRTKKLRRPETDVAALTRDVELIRQVGYGESLGHGGMTAVAAPVWGPGYTLLGTISSILSLEMFERDHATVAKFLVTASKKLSAQLGAPTI